MYRCSGEPEVPQPIGKILAIRLGALAQSLAFAFGHADWRQHFGAHKSAIFERFPTSRHHLCIRLLTWTIKRIYA